MITYLDVPSKITTPALKTKRGEENRSPHRPERPEGPLNLEKLASIELEVHQLRTHVRGRDVYVRSHFSLSLG